MINKFEFSVKDKNVTSVQFSTGKWHLVIRDMESEMDAHRFLKFWQNIQRVDVYWKEGFEGFGFSDCHDNRLCRVHELHFIFPKSIKSFDFAPFLFYPNLKSINIPNDEMTFSENPFCGLNVQLILPEGATRTKFENGLLIVDNQLIGGACCEGSVKIPDYVTSMLNDAFSHCKKMTECVVSKGITKIPNYAFECCSELIQVEIPDSVKDISENAFLGCYKLESPNVSKFQKD